MLEALFVILVIPGFLIVFPLFWMAVVWIISRVGGWGRLASKFAADAPASGEAFYWTSARIGWFANYGSCLNVCVSGRGVRIEPIFLFKFGHKPLLLP